MNNFFAALFFGIMGWFALGIVIDGTSSADLPVSLLVSGGCLMAACLILAVYMLVEIEAKLHKTLVPEASTMSWVDPEATAESVVMSRHTIVVNKWDSQCGACGSTQGSLRLGDFCPDCSTRHFFMATSSYLDESNPEKEIAELKKHLDSDLEFIGVVSGGGGNYRLHRPMPAYQTVGWL